jgi:hypothetical protein
MQLAEDESIAYDLQRVVHLAKQENKDFIHSLIWTVTKAKRTWSDKQRYWAKKYLSELQAVKVESVNKQIAQEAHLQGLTFPKIAALFSKALATGLAYPKISYALEDCLVVLAWSPSYGSIAVRVGNRSVGALSKTGAMDKQYPIKDATLLDCLQEIEKDPIAAAKVSGKQTGHCCFCSRELSDARSLFHSYGPVCADHWGLPWDVQGEELEQAKQASKVTFDAKEL